MVIKPQRLKIGDTIGICAPGGPPDLEKLASGTIFLRDLGFNLVFGETLRKRRGYLAGPDQERAEELQKMFEAENIDAVFCARGGTGSLRLLAHLDFQRLSGHPKIFMGYSDITCLQLALYTKLKWLTFQGPMVAVDLVAKSCRPEIENPFWLELLMGRAPSDMVLVGSPRLAGQTRGRLLGGCLSMIRSLCGSEFMPSDEAIVLFWEDINEEPYRLDMMLQQLRLAGVLERVRAMLVGELVNCSPQDDSPSLTIDEILLDYCKPLGIPLITDLPFGHGSGNLVLPQGTLVDVDGAAGSIQLTEAVVI